MGTPVCSSFLRLEHATAVNVKGSADGATRIRCEPNSVRSGWTLRIFSIVRHLIIAFLESLLHFHLIPCIIVYCQNIIAYSYIIDFFTILIDLSCACSIIHVLKHNTLIHIFRIKIIFCNWSFHYCLYLLTIRCA